MRLTSFLLRLAGLVLAMVVIGRGAAATIHWDGGGDGVRWEDPVNWSGNVLPGPVDDAILGAGGEVRIDGGALISVNTATVRRPLRLVSGGLRTVDGLSVETSQLIFDGGRLDGPVLLLSSQLVLADTATSVEPARLAGDCTMSGNIPVGLRIIVLGQSSGGHARTVWLSGGVNRGTIRLDSRNAGWWSRLVLAVAPIVNEAGGRIEAGPGTGGSRVIEGSVRNLGTLVGEAGAELQVTTVLTGTVELRGVSVEVGDGARIEVSQGSVLWDGGRISGNGRLVTLRIPVRVTSGVTEAGTLVAAGDWVFLGNDSPVATVLSEGSSAYGHATLRLAADAVNRGQLRFDSQNAG